MRQRQVTLKNVCVYQPRMSDAFLADSVNSTLASVYTI